MSPHPSACPPPRRHARRAPSVRRTAVPALAPLALLLAARPAAGQGVDDGLLLPARELRTTVTYGHERWTEYWEGGLRRTNENIGAVTTRSVAWTGGYGLTDRLSVVATLPYVWTEASQGVLQGMRGAQDLTVALKYRLAQGTFGQRTTVRALLVAGAGTPTTDYTPDFQPLSIGLGSRRALARAALHVRDRGGWYADGSAGHAWRANVRLDRPAYYTDGKLVLSDEVAMPGVFDYVVAAGWQGRRLTLPVALSGQRTLGGGDIRRQDMPFVSNRMNFTRVHAGVGLLLPVPAAVSVQLGAAHTLDGRNVGRATAFTAGVTHALRL